MEVICAVTALAAMVWGAIAFARASVRVCRGTSARLAQRRAQGASRRAEAARSQRQRNHLNSLARMLQLSLFRIDRAPDFRRAASCAARAQEVPVAFRQRQFLRFRPKLVAYMSNRLQAGADAESLTNSLTDLLRHLGIAPFEADYIRTEAERSLTARPVAAAPTYAQQLAQLQRDHEQRLAALQESGTLEPEVREQMEEAEEQRFRQALLQLNDGAVDAE